MEPIHLFCYDNSDLNSSPFGAWFQQFRLPSGRNGDPDTCSSLEEICGTEIGKIHTPAESAAVEDVGWIFVGLDPANVFKCYAAVRLCSRERTIVIDLFGVHESLRHQRMGQKFYHMMSEELTRRLCNHFGESDYYHFSVQSTFKYDSYLQALALMSVVVEETHTKVICKFDKAQVARMLTGSCQFWRKMGFIYCKMDFSNGRGLMSPVLIMWTEKCKRK